MPASRKHWSLAARNELHAITDDRAALLWALGGLRTACTARWRSLHLLDRRSVRWSSAALSLCCALIVALPPLMTLAFRLQLDALLIALGRITPGGEWQPFVPLMEQLPGWLHTVLLGAGFCYLAGAMGVLRRRSSTAFTVGAGLVLDLAARALGQHLIAPTAVVIRDSSLLAEVIVPVFLPVLISIAASAGSRTEAG
jgi:hypothetical protein